MSQSVLEVSERIHREAVEKNVPEVRRIDKMEVGQVVRQGDIYIHCVDASHERGRRVFTRQLVHGVTNGSRHIALEPSYIFNGTKLPEWAPTALIGPVVESKERVLITHPEHAHYDLPAGTYQITYQRDIRTGDAVKD